MKKLLLPLAVIAAVAPAYAVEIGSPELTADANDIAFSLHYYYDESDWDTGSRKGNRILDQLERQGVVGKFTIGLHKNLEVFARLGLEDMESDPALNEYRFTSRGDSFVGVGMKGVVFRNDDWTVGPFIQYTGFSNQSIAGNIADGGVLRPLDVEVEDFSTLEAGVSAQYSLEKFDLFGGLYAYKTDADVSGTYDGAPLETDIEEDGNLGLFIGANYAISNNWLASAEAQVNSGAGIAIGIHYLLGAPEPATRTEKVVEIQTVKEVVYVEKPVSTIRYEGNVHFASGSAAIDNNHQVDVAEFAGFLNDNPQARGLIEGYCDCDGPNSANLKLAKSRAEAVKTMLVDQHGIEADRLSIQAFGEELAKAPADDVTGKAVDRKVRVIGLIE